MGGSVGDRGQVGPYCLNPRANDEGFFPTIDKFLLMLVGYGIRGWAEFDEKTQGCVLGLPG